MQKDDVQNNKTFSVLVCTANFYILLLKKVWVCFLNQREYSSAVVRFGFA